jgi:small basic protein
MKIIIGLLIVGFIIQMATEYTFWFLVSICVFACFVTVMGVLEHIRNKKQEEIAFLIKKNGKYKGKKVVIRSYYDFINVQLSKSK